MTTRSSSAASTVVTAAVVSAAIATGAAAVASLLLLWRERKTYVDAPTPPGSSLILGNVADLVEHMEHRFDYVTELAEQYGPTWRIRHPDFTSHVWTVDPAVIEFMLKTNFNDFVKGPILSKKLFPLFGDGIFNSDGEVWRVQRKTSSFIFTGKMFREVTEVVLHEDLQRLLAYLTTKADKGMAIDLHHVMHAFTLDTFAQIGFGLDLNGLTDPDVKPEFAVSFDRLQGIINKRFFLGDVYEIVETFNGDAAQIKKDLKVINDLILARIRQKREELREEQLSGRGAGRRMDLLDLFMEKEEGAEVSEKYLRDMVLNMMLAGRDTTAQSLAWAFCRLCARPDIVTKIREELKEVLDDQLPSYDDVNKLKYANAVFLETLRLHGPVASDLKYAAKDLVLPGGIAIPKGTEIVWFPYAMGRMTWIWGPDAKDFKPERWIDEQGNLRRENQFKFPAFNAGPRVCLGQQFAMVEGVTVLAALCRDFTFSRVGGNDQSPPGFALSITAAMLDGLPVYVSSRR